MKTLSGVMPSNSHDPVAFPGPQALLSVTLCCGVQLHSSAPLSLPSYLLAVLLHRLQLVPVINLIYGLWADWSESEKCGVEEGGTSGSNGGGETGLANMFNSSHAFPESELH